MDTSIFNNHDNKSKIAIVCVGYNRVKSLKRLFDSLLRANYPDEDIPLIFSIDASGDQDVYEFVRNAEWPFGHKYVNIEENRLGLKKHIFQCGGLTKFFKAVIILEDDLYVSPSFYYYTISAVDKYGDNDSVGGIALYSSDMNGFASLPFEARKTGSDVFAWQTVISWGQCWTYEMWSRFYAWYEDNEGIDMTDIDMPERIKHWERAWSKFYYSYLIQTNRYFIIPYDSFSTNFSEVGEHTSVKIENFMVQMRLVMGDKRTYCMADFESLPKYDVFGNPFGLEDYLKVPKDDLCVSFYNDRKLKGKYLLSPYKYNYKIIKTFGISFRPIELNIILDNKGDGLYLYDMSDGESSDKGRINYQYSRYMVKDTSPKMLLKYSVEYYMRAIVKKFTKRNKR